MTENMILSIIVPIYNGAEYIDRCVMSVIREYCFGIELLLIDDGSEDDSLRKCNGWQSTYRWIRVLHHENHGVSETRNRGIQAARGKYIWFVDVDDVILQNSIASMIKIIESEEPDILLFGYKSKLARKQLNEFDTNPQEQAQYRVEKDVSDFFWGFLGKNLIHNIGNKLYLMEMLRVNNIEFNAGLSIYEDALFCVNALRSATNLSVYPCAWYCYNLEENKQSLNHGYRNNYFTGVSLLFENIAKLLGKKDKRYYETYTNALLGVFANEFRNKGYSYKEFQEYVQRILSEDQVKEALVWINSEEISDKKWKLILANKYYKCYLVFKIGNIKKTLLNLDAVNNLFDMAYCLYKWFRLFCQQIEKNFFCIKRDKGEEHGD